MRKDKFQLRSNLFVAIVLFDEGELPKVYLIPSEEWKKPNEILVDRKYEEKKSPPEWGLNLSLKNMPILEKYVFEKQVMKL